MSKKNKMCLFFYSNSAIFVSGSAKILFAPGAGYPSYAIDQWRGNYFWTRRQKPGAQIDGIFIDLDRVFVPEISVL